MGVAKILLSNVSIDCEPEYLRAWVEARGYRVSRLILGRNGFAEETVNFAYVQLMQSGKLDEAVRTLNGQLLGGRRIQVTRAEFSDNVSRFTRTVA